MNIKKIAAAGIAAAGILAYTMPVFAHGGGNPNNQYYVDPESPSCMGELARLHANGKNPGTNPDTENGFYTNQPHPGLGGPYDTVQEQAKAFQEYCELGPTE